MPDFIVISVMNLITCKAAAELKLFQNKKNETARLVPSQTYAVTDFIEIIVMNLIAPEVAAELKLFQKKKNETARLVPSQT